MSLFLDPYKILSEVYGKGAHLKIALQHLPPAHGRTVKLVYGVLEHDRYLSLCIGTFAARSPKTPVRIALKLALCGLLYCDMPRYAVTDEAVALVKELGKGGAAGFVNAFLRAFDEKKVHLPAGEEGLSVASNFPLFAVREIQAAYGERAPAILLAKSRGVSVRFVRGMERYLSLPHEDTPFPNVKIFRNFSRDEGFARGDYTFQSVGSVAVASVVAPCARLLDACAAPGGKAVLLKERCQTVVACDVYPHRAALIGSYARRMGADVETRVCDSAVFCPEWEGAFDAVLCDVPCSGLGTVAENPDLPLRRREEDMPALIALQRAILENCARYVRRGGALYYATCSVLPRENDGAVGEFLSCHAAFSVLPCESPLAHERTAYGLQFLPDTAFGAGFYVAALGRET